MTGPIPDKLARMGRRIAGKMQPLPEYGSLEEMAADIGVPPATLLSFAQNLKAVASSGVSVNELARELEEGRRRIGAPASEILVRFSAASR